VFACKDLNQFTLCPAFKQLPWAQLIPLLGEDSGWLWPLFDPLFEAGHREGVDFCRALVRALPLSVLMEKIAEPVKAIKALVGNKQPGRDVSGKKLGLWMERADAAERLAMEIGLTKENVPRVFSIQMTKDAILRRLPATAEEDRKAINV
jgi:hypothetical protein